MALLTSFGLKPLILTSFEAAGWQLIHVVGVVPRTGASGGTPGQVKVPAPASLTQFQSSGQMWHTPSLGLQQQERQQQHGPGKWEEAGGGTVTDAVQNLRLGVVCKVRAKALRGAAPLLALALSPARFPVPNSLKQTPFCAPGPICSSYLPAGSLFSCGLAWASGL